MNAMIPIQVGDGSGNVEFTPSDDDRDRIIRKIVEEEVKKVCREVLYKETQDFAQKFAETKREWAVSIDELKRELDNISSNVTELRGINLDFIKNSVEGLRADINDLKGISPNSPNSDNGRINSLEGAMNNLAVVITNFLDAFNRATDMGSQLPFFQKTEDRNMLGRKLINEEVSKALFENICNIRCRLTSVESAYNSGKSRY